MEKEKPGYRFATLDGLRGVAALCVMSMHLTTATRHRMPISAFLAVDLFFILSGFVLAHAYGERICDGSISFGNFMLRRAIRLYPVYILSIALGITIMLSLHGRSASTYSVASILGSGVTNSFFLPYLNHGTLEIVGLRAPGFLFPANIAAWSLFFEMLGSMALWGFVRLGRWPLALLALSFLLGLILYGAWPSLQKLPNRFIEVGFLFSNFAGGFFRVGYGMTLGVLLYRFFVLLDGRWKTSDHPGLLAGLSPILYLTLVTALSLAFPSYGGLYELLVVLIAAPAAVLCGAFMQPAGFWHSIEDWLGRLSYPIYCFHIPFLILFYNAGLINTQNWSVIPCAATVMLASAFVFKYWDEPIRARLTRMLIRKPVRYTEASALRGA